MGYIYNATNIINGKGYVGQTIRPIKERLKEHQFGKSKNCKGIAGAIKKYGWDSFIIDCYECPDDELNKHERWMVNLMGTLSPNGYNLKEGGGNRGKYSEETKQKMRKPKSEETKQKISKGHIGKKASNKTKQKLSESRKGEKNHRSKRVYQYDLEGNLLGTFGTSEEASIHLKKKCATNIRACACGKRKTAYNFKWSYEKY